jgi:hypothetical protein
MKLLKLTLIIFSLSAITALHSCKPEEDPPQQDLGFFPLGKIKDYHCFKKGSWWVYRNSLTGKLDTQIVTDVYIDTVYQSTKKQKVAIEDLAYTVYSKSTKWIYDNYNHPGGISIPNWKWNYHMKTNKHGRGFAGETETFFYPFERNDGKSNYAWSFQDTLKNFTLLGKTYSDVAVFFILHDDIEDYPLKGESAKYYWAKGVGLVYHEIRDFNDTSKILKKDELIEYNIYK